MRVHRTTLTVITEVEDDSDLERTLEAVVDVTIEAGSTYFPSVYDYDFRELNLDGIPIPPSAPWYADLANIADIQLAEVIRYYKVPDYDYDLDDPRL